MKVVIPVLAAAIAAACVDISAALTTQLEARRLASAMHVEFARASAASNRAVVADTDEASAAAAGEAREARQAVDTNLERLRRVLVALGDGDDIRQLDAFKIRYEAYRQLDDEILPLAIENSAADARSLSSALGRKQLVTAQCNDQLRMLEQALAAHQSAATR